MPAHRAEMARFDCSGTAQILHNAKMALSCLGIAMGRRLPCRSITRGTERALALPGRL